MIRPPAPAAGYRPQLDGLRAFAVVAVILFHLGYPWIPGGFVGVDVFFVLSGYLITGILVDEAAKRETVRLGRFYARRVRRLLPASAAVLIAVLAATWFLFDPIQKQSLGWDATFAALYSANWRFALVGGDYFAPGDVPSPLVHYWSLAVEEQFYLVWPALVLLLWKVARKVRPKQPLTVIFVGVAALTTASVIASVALAGTPLTYYGTHTRAYQLLAGGLLAVGARRWGWHLPDTARGRVGGATLAVAGLVVLGYLAHTLVGASSYPGWPGVWVTLASLALITGVDLVPAGITTAVIGHRSLAAVGRLSYSLYIWHWPAIVLFPLVAQRHGGIWKHLDNRTVMTALIVVAAAVSYVVVETPIRFRLAPKTRPVPVVAVGLSMSLLLGVSAYVLTQPRDDFAQQTLAAVRDLAKPGDCPYFPEDWPAATDSEPCLYRKGTGPVVAFVGDSHGQQWQPALEVLAERQDATLIRATRGGCPANDVTAFLRDATNQIQVETDCVDWRRHVYAELITTYDPDVVIVGTRSFFKGLKVGDDLVYKGNPKHLRAWSDGWNATLDTLTSGGATVVVNQMMPTLPERVPACLIDHGKGTTDCDFPVSGDTDVVPYATALATFDDSRGGKVQVIDPIPLACPDGVCPAVMDGEIVHRDDNHLSATFVRNHAREYGELLTAAGAGF